MRELEQRVGAHKHKLAAIRAIYPLCYYSGSTTPDIIEHMPSRIIFRNKIRPEGYEFLACKKCNRNTSQMEQALALYFRLAESSVAPADEATFNRIVAGVYNNNRNLLPLIDLSANEKRKILREGGLPMPHRGFLADVPLAVLPKEASDPKEQFARRLTCALHYKHRRYLIRLQDNIFTQTFPFKHNKTKYVVDKLEPLLRNIIATNRVNTDIGHQFVYAWGENEDEGIFAMLCQFGKSHFIVGSVCPSALGRDPCPKWKLHANDIGANG